MAMTEIAQSIVLSAEQQKSLAFYEQRMELAVQQHQVASIAFATALRAINQQDLYKQYGTFEDYCRERWQRGRQWAYHLIEAAKVIENVYDRVQSAPTSEFQVRPLARLEADQQVQAWERASEIADGGNVTNQHVRQAVAEITTPAADRLAVHKSSESAEWYTPSLIIDRVVEFFDQIDLDPCSNSHEAPNVPAVDVFTQEDDGLVQPWHGRVYVNPPYGDTIGLWVAKLCDAYQSGEIEAGIALLPGRIDTRWFRRLRSYAVCFLWGRLQFVGADNSAPFPSILVYLGTEVDRFRHVTKTIGDVWVCAGVTPGVRVLEEVEL